MPGMTCRDSCRRRIEGETWSERVAGSESPIQTTSSAPSGGCTGGGAGRCVSGFAIRGCVGAAAGDLRPVRYPKVRSAIARLAYG